MTFNTRLQQLLAERANAERFSGVVLVARDGQPLCAAAHGYANRSWRVENRMDTRFRIASVSKMFTAVAVLQLVEQGTLSLETPVADCLGLAGTQIPAQATVHHMLTMTASIADWFEEAEGEEAWAALCRTQPLYLLRAHADYLPLFVHKEPHGPVGEKHRYSNASYILLGLLVEKVAGLSYFDFIRRHIFAPAWMARDIYLSLDDVDP